MISGRFVTEDGSPVAVIEVVAARGEAWSFAYLDPDLGGPFSITVPDPGDYNVHFIDDGCAIHYSTSAATTEWDVITWITVDDSDVTGIEFVVPDDPASLCR